MIEVTLSEVRDFAVLGTKWRALEDRVDASFFQSWTWTGCLAAERFPDPVLVEARSGGETVGLALFNRRRGLGRGILYLGETGAAPWDRLAVEHNGPLAASAAVASAMLNAAAARYDLMVSGTTGTYPGLVLKAQPAPFADLTIPDYLGRRGANTRQQIRRSDRAFGVLSLARAETEETAHAWLDEMAVLHQATWTARGKSGAFADPFFGRFHHELIRRGLPRGEIDLWRVSAADRVVGILYNFRYRGRALAYQSGLAYDPADARRKPGLTCHRLAIEACARDGLICYDFLAGDARYKRSLADGEQTMRWILNAPWWSPRMLAQWAHSIAGTLRAMVGGRRT